MGDYNELYGEEKVHEHLKIIAGSSLIVLIGIIISKGLTWLYRIIVARQFGAEVYGLFTLALMVSVVFIALSTAGFTEGIGRFIPFYKALGKEREVRHIFRFGLFTLLATSIISALLLILLSKPLSLFVFKNFSLIAFLKIFSISIPFMAVASFLLSVLRGYKEIWWNTFLFNIFQNAAKVVMLVVFVIIGLSSISVAWAYVLGVVLLTLFTSAVIKIKYPGIFQRALLEISKAKQINSSFLRYSFPLLFFSIISVFFYWIDSFSLGYFKSAIEVGWYNAAVPIALLLGVVPELFLQMFFPIIVAAYAKKEKNIIEQVSKQVGKWIFIFNVPIFLLLLLFPGAFINVLFGESFLPASSALSILALGSLISSLGIVSQQLISMKGKSRLILTDVCIAAIVNVLLNWLLIPQERIFFISNPDGLEGAALATLLSIFLLQVLFFVQAHRSLSFVPLRQKMLGILGVGVLSCAFLLYVRNNFFLGGLGTLFLLTILFFLVYILLLLVTRCFDKNDYAILEKILKKLRFKKS